MRVFLLLILLLAFGAQAQVFTWINKDGVREYGDEPPEHASKADLPDIQSIPKDVFAKTPAADKTTTPSTTQPKFAGYKKLLILSPKMDHAVLAGDAGQLTVELFLEPSLQPGHEVTLFLNGKPVNTAAQLQFSLENLDRGSHMIHAQIKHQGTTLIRSAKRRFHVQRPSILNRARAQ